jgi:hypothetical protein
MRISDAEREATVQRLQVAFAEGRLTDEEFDGRMRSALVARTQGDLDEVAHDLPAPAGAVVPSGPTSGRRVIAYKSSVRRRGRWRVPGRLRVLIYKGSAVIDLRAAELTKPVTHVRAVAYKSRIEVIVPPGVRVESSGVGVCQDVIGDTGTGPLVRIHGIAYKGGIDARS